MIGEQPCKKRVWEAQQARQQSAISPGSPKCILECIKHCMTSWGKAMSVTLYSVLMQPHHKPHNLRRTWWSFMVSKGGDKQSWWKGWRKCPVRRRGQFWVCLVCRKEGWGITSFLSTVFWDGEITSPRYAVIGLVWVVPSCTRGRFRLVIRKHFFTKRVKDWNRLLREVINASGLSVFKRHLDNVLNNMF